MEYLTTLSALLLLLLFVTTVPEVSSFPLTIVPSHARVQPRDNVTIVCSNPEKEFTDCQFTWWDVDDQIEGPHFDFSRGHNSESAYLANDVTLINYRLAGYKYHGDGLKYGQCGIQLFGVMLRYRMVACRARTRDSGWVYASMSVCSEDRPPVELKFTSTEPVVLPGNSVTILSQTKNGEPMSACNFRFPGMGVLTFNASSGTSSTTRRPANRHPPLHHGRENTGRTERQTRVATPPGPSPSVGRNNSWAFAGAGLQQGQCGVTLNNVAEERNGWVYFDTETPDGAFDRRVFYLTVARPPANMSLVVSNHAPIEREIYNATCTVSDSRPVANVTWYLGDSIIRRDNLDDSVVENQADSAWRWKHGLHPIVQTMALLARKEDSGKVLRCVVEHIALAKALVAGKTITVQSQQNTPVPRPRPVQSPGNTAQQNTPVPRPRPVQSPGNTAQQTTPVPRPGPVQSPGNTVKCPAIPTKDALATACQLGPRAVDCSRPMPVGTEVTMYLDCNRRQTVVSSPLNRTVTCQRTGMWDKPVVTCPTTGAPAGCGRSERTERQRPLVSGTRVEYGDFPWHVAIYQLKNGAYHQICSGSLLSMTTVVTAASCFWKRSYDRTFNGSLYKIAAGKLNRDATVEEDHVQWRDVASAKVRERFTGRDTSFQFNIALLKPTKPFDNTEYVNKVCVDWRRERLQPQLKTGQTGFVAGWGFLEEDSPGPVLKSVGLPYVSFRECHQALSPEVKRQFTGDKFCAGSTDEYHGYTICESDYGAGLVIYNEPALRYELRGVASVAFKPVHNKEECYSSQFAAFTMFSMFTEWIQENMN